MDRQSSEVMCLPARNPAVQDAIGVALTWQLRFTGNGRPGG